MGRSELGTRRFYVILAVLCASLVPATSDCNGVFDETYYIVHRSTGRVISGYSSNHDVDLQILENSYVASFYNTWIMEPTPRPGLFFISIKCCTIGVLGFNRETFDLERGSHTDSIYQQWFFDADGRIVNGGAYNYGLRVNRTVLGQFDVYVGSMEDSTDDDIFEFIVSQW